MSNIFCLCCKYIAYKGLPRGIKNTEEKIIFGEWEACEISS